MARIRGPLPFDQFSQRVRRHRPTEVLAAVARYSAALEADGFWFGEWPGQPVQVQYFALAGAARAALLYGNEFRDSGVSDGDVIEICIYFGEVDDPATKQEPGLDRMRGMLLRYLYDQAPYQYSPVENIARSVALFLEHADGCDGALTENEWRGLLGASLEEFMRIGFVLHTAAIRNEGQIARDTLRAMHVAPIFTPLSTDEAVAVIDELYAGTIDELRALGHAAEVKGTFHSHLCAVGVPPTAGALAYLLDPAGVAVLFPHEEPHKPILMGVGSMEELVGLAETEHGQSLAG